MSWIDILVIVIYLIAMVVFGLVIQKSNKNLDDYFLGGKKLSSFHIGLSVVATDVGGGFSIGLGGLGFTIGLSGSWMLLTGLLGAWLSAVFIIPKIKKIEEKRTFYSYPEVFEHLNSKTLVFIVALVSIIGYVGFTGAQILAGAKLASATLPGVSQNLALIIMGVVAVLYTAVGGIKAVIYTDTVQWIILFIGLGFIGIPMAYFHLGGWDAIIASLAPEYISLTNLTSDMIINWVVSIIPIWFIGLTLYQRIFACKDLKTARKAWYIAGVLEWPFMAFMGVLLGTLAKAAVNQGLLGELAGAGAGVTGSIVSDTIDSETAMPLLIRTILPSGILGLVLAAYFSAILSTADSCLMATSGSIVRDFISKWTTKSETLLNISKLVTIVVGIISLVIASQFGNVLSLMLYSYGFMVSGLFLPTLLRFYWKKPVPGALILMVLCGGTISVIGQLAQSNALGFTIGPENIESTLALKTLSLNPNLLGIIATLLVFFGFLASRYFLKSRTSHRAIDP